MDSFRLYDNSILSIENAYKIILEWLELYIENKIIKSIGFKIEGKFFYTRVAKDGIIGLDI
jgi:hypothetical protein